MLCMRTRGARHPEAALVRDAALAAAVRATVVELVRVSGPEGSEGVAFVVMTESAFDSLIIASFPQQFAPFCNKFNHDAN